MRGQVLSSGLLDRDDGGLGGVVRVGFLCQLVVVQIGGIPSSNDQVELIRVRMSDEEDRFRIRWDRDGYFWAADWRTSFLCFLTRKGSIRKRLEREDTNLLIPPGASCDAEWLPSLRTVDTASCDYHLDSVLGMMPSRLQAPLSSPIEIHVP